MLLNHFMLDLETRGTVPGCAIVSIGVVAFNPEVGLISPDAFYSVVNLQSCLDAGLHVDEETTKWWEQQSPSAQSALAYSMLPHAPTLTKALIAMDVYMANYAPALDRFVWGNGADFDNAILQTALAMIGMEQIWTPWKNRCHRTMKSQAPQVKIDRSKGTHHNAKDDAIAQAAQLISVYRELGWAGSQSETSAGREDPASSQNPA